MSNFIFEIGSQKFLKIGSAIFLVFISSSCGSLIPKATPKEIFILGAQQEHFCESISVKGLISLIDVQASADFFESQKIIFRKNSQLGNYQFAQWSESVPDRIKKLLSERLRCEGYQIGANIQEVKNNGIDLKINLLDFSHDISTSPGKFNAVLRVTKTKGPESVEKLFSFESQVDSYDAEGARVAADKVIEQLLNSIVSFILEGRSPSVRG